MLVLSRKKNQRIRIGGGIEICVVEIRGDKVRLGIEAPRSVAVLRDDANVIVPRACDPGQEGDALRQTHEIPGVHRDGRDGLPPGEAVDPSHEELLFGATVPAE